MRRILALQAMMAAGMDNAGMADADMVSGCSFTASGGCSSCSDSGCQTFGANFIAL